MSEQQQPADTGTGGLIKALTQHVEAMRLQTDAMLQLTHSNLMLSAAVAELIGEEAGIPAQDQEPKEPVPDHLDAD